jgi:hypothetical protein
MKLPPEMPPPILSVVGQNYRQRLRSFRPDTHMKHWIIAALICSACAAYAAEDDNKIHPTCVDDATRADVGSSRAAAPDCLQLALAGGARLHLGKYEESAAWLGRVRSLSSAVRRITGTEVAGSEAENVIKYARAARSDVTSSGSSI